MSLFQAKLQKKQNFVSQAFALNLGAFTFRLFSFRKMLGNNFGGLFCLHPIAISCHVFVLLCTTIEFAGTSDLLTLKEYEHLNMSFQLLRLAAFVGECLARTKIFRPRRRRVVDVPPPPCSCTSATSEHHASISHEIQRSHFVLARKLLFQTAARSNPIDARDSRRQ